MKKVFLSLALGLLSCHHSFAARCNSRCGPGGRCGPESCVYHANCKDFDTPVIFTAPVYGCLSGDWGLSLTVDYLFWFGKEANLVVLQETSGISVTSVGGTITVPVFINLPKEDKQLVEKWRSAFRIGLGKSFSCDGWDVYASWTYFNPKSRNKKSVSPFQIGVPTDFLLSPWTNPLFGADLDITSGGATLFGFIPIYTKIKTKWREWINIIDFEVGRNYWLSPYLTLRPFIGARGAWDHNKLTAKNFLEASPGGLLSFDKVRFRNRFWGAGLLAGCKSTWLFCNGFGFFGNADLAILWGEFRNRRKENVTNILLGLISPFEIPTMKNEFSSLQPILDLAAGLRVESTFYHNRIYGALEVGWEQHYWFNHFCHYKFRGGLGGLSRSSGFTQLNFITSDFDQFNTDFIFGGVNVRIRIDF